MNLADVSLEYFQQILVDTLLPADFLQEPERSVQLVVILVQDVLARSGNTRGTGICHFGIRLFLGFPGKGVLLFHILLVQMLGLRVIRMI